MALVAVKAVCHAGVLYGPGDPLPAGVDEARLLRLGAAREDKPKAKPKKGEE